MKNAPFIATIAFALAALAPGQTAAADDKPYQVAGQWYYPRHQPDYDASGSASWYGDDFHGKHTANGGEFMTATG